MKRVGLIGSPERQEIVRLQIRLEERSAEGVVLDPRGDPRLELQWGGAEAPAARASACGVELSGFAAFYVADLGLPSPVVRREDGSSDPAASALALAASRRRLAAWNAVLERLALHALVVNPVRTHDLHSLKPWETFVYAREGLPHPETLVTSDPEALLALAGAPGAAGRVRKGLVGGYGYTEAFVPSPARAEAAAALAVAPALIQERVAGLNVRAFVVGGEVIGAAEVTGGAGDPDSRRETARLRPIDLPPEAAATAVAAAARWGLAFAAADFMREERTGRFLLLECNSAPFFVNFEKATGIPVSGRLADLLAGRKVRR